MDSRKIRRKKLALYEQLNGKCQVCSNVYDVMFMTIDHIVPKQHGGTNRSENLRLACWKCNQILSGSTKRKNIYQIFAAWMALGTMQAPPLKVARRTRVRWF